MALSRCRYREDILMFISMKKQYRFPFYWQILIPHISNGAHPDLLLEVCSPAEWIRAGRAPGVMPQMRRGKTSKVSMTGYETEDIRAIVVEETFWASVHPENNQSHFWSHQQHCIFRFKAFVWRLWSFLALWPRTGSPSLCLSCTFPIWVSKGIAWRSAEILRTFSVTCHQCLSFFLTFTPAFKVFLGKVIQSLLLQISIGDATCSSLKAIKATPLCPQAYSHGPEQTIPVSVK